MSKAEDFRIEDVRKATVNGQSVKLFRAYKKQGDAFVHVGQFSAPQRTADKDLWKVAAEAI